MHSYPGFIHPLGLWLGMFALAKKTDTKEMARTPKKRNAGTDKPEMREYLNSDLQAQIREIKNEKKDYRS